MIHYTCDRCQRTMNPSLEIRYQVKIDVHAIGQSDELSPSEDTDSLSELHQLLGGLGDDEHTPSHEATSCLTHYDLCPRCYRQFSSNPLGRELAIAIGFSNN